MESKKILLVFTMMSTLAKLGSSQLYLDGTYGNLSIGTVLPAPQLYPTIMLWTNGPPPEQASWLVPSI